MPEDILEKIFPKDKALHNIKEKKVPEIEEIIPPEKPLAIPEKILPDQKIFEEKLNKMEVILEEFDEKIKMLQEKIRNLEESASAVESSKEIKGFDKFTQEFYDKLSEIEEARAQIFIQGSKIQSKYLEIVKRLDDVEYFLEKMKSFEKFLMQLQNLERFETDIRILRESLYNLKLAFLEQKFYSLVAIIPTVKKKEVLINLLDEFDRTIEELKRNDMYRYDKMTLSSEVLESPNVKELNLT
ncbi:MAG: hypothetical protein QXL86_00380 [Candidatus Aenigmatarchaeota archaeon]